MPHHLRVARPVIDLERTVAMYGRGLGLDEIGRFEDHAGFDGVMLGQLDAHYHLEFTRSRSHPVAPTSTSDDLLVFYLPDAEQWQLSCRPMIEAGFEEVPPLNPYWGRSGRTFQDPDGYRVVLQQAEWSNSAGS